MLGVQQLVECPLLEALPVTSEEFADPHRRTGAQDAASRDHAGQAAGRICAAAETEYENLITVVVVRDQPFIRVRDEVVDPAPEDAAPDLLSERRSKAFRVV